MITDYENQVIEAFIEQYPQHKANYNHLHILSSGSVYLHCGLAKPLYFDSVFMGFKQWQAKLVDWTAN